MGAVRNTVRNTVRAVTENPEKLLLASAMSVVAPGSGLLYLGKEGRDQKKEDAKKQRALTGMAQDQADREAAAADLLVANESVLAQKEKARKQTVFGGSAQANLFNKSLIGASTTAAAGTSRSILGT